MKISNVYAYEIFDARGWPTVQCEVTLRDGKKFSGYAASTALKDFKEMRDGGKRLWGRGIDSAVATINHTIAPLLIGQNMNAPELDFMLIEQDGTPDKSNFGSNCMTAVSMALYKAQAYVEKMELYELLASLVNSQTVSVPYPQVTILTNSQAFLNNTFLIPEFMVAPVGADSFRSAYNQCVTLFHELKTLFYKYNKPFDISTEGGFIVSYKNNNEVLELLVEAIERSASDTSCVLAINCEAGNYYHSLSKNYVIGSEHYSSSDLIKMYNELIHQFPIYSIQDGLGGEDWKGWEQLETKLGEKIQLVGDSLYMCQPHRLLYAQEKEIFSVMVLKPSQGITVTEALQMVNFNRQRKRSMVVAPGYGETEDPFIADFSIGTSIGQYKGGGPTRSELVGKYNRILTIEDKLHSL